MYYNGPNYSRNHPSLSSANAEIMIKNVPQLCFIMGLQLEKLYFVFIKRCVHYLKFCVYTWIHIVIFFYDDIVAMSSFMLLVGQTCGCF